jgi:trigger factor
MQVTVVPGIRLEHRIEVSIDAQRVGKELDKVVGDIARKVQIPGGYRKFELKVARVRQLYRKDVAAQVASDLIEGTLFDAIVEAGIRAVGTPKIVNMGTPWYGAGFSYSVSVEARPTLDIVHYKGILLPVTGAEVTAEMVDEEVESVRKQHVQRVPFTGERLEAGLEVALSAEPCVEDAELKEKLTRDITVLLGPDGIRPFLLDKLIGSPAGAEIEVDAPAGDMPGWTEPASRSVQARWKVVTRDPKTLVVPPADDELAKMAGNNSLLALRGALREKLEKQLKDEESRLQAEAVADQLIGKNRLHVPERAVAEIFQERMRNRAREMKQTYPNLPEEMLTRLLQYNAQEELYRTILGARLEFVLEDVADLEGITVSDEDVEARIRELVGDENVTEEFLRSRVGPEERESLRISIRRQKAREAVERHAVRIPAADYSQHMRRLRAGRNLVKRGGRKALLRRTRSSRARRTQSNG